MLRDLADSPIRVRPPVPEQEAIEELHTAEVKVLGRLPWSSNATFLVDLQRSDGSVRLQGVYKPEQGERPLWDFPPGLYKREVAAYVLSRHLGWDLVPPTVERDAPLGRGSLQLFVPADFEQHYFLLCRRKELWPSLAKLCAFDVVSNAADRKGGHVLLEGAERIWAVDNGLCFHQEFKLRTVVWDFAGQRLPEEVGGTLSRLCEQGSLADLDGLLNASEQSALFERADALLSLGRFPEPSSRGGFPWPPV